MPDRGLSHPNRGQDRQLAYRGAGYAHRLCGARLAIQAAMKASSLSCFVPGTARPS